MTSDTADMDVNNVPQYQKSNTNVQYPPFPTLMGEHVLLLSKTTDGTAMVTNFRFCVCERRSFINLPLMMVGELTVVEASRWLRIGCKDGSNYCCTFATSEDCRICTTLLRERIVVPKRSQDMFPYSFHAAATQRLNSGVNLTQTEQDQMTLCKPVSEAFAYSFGKEVERMGFDTNRRRIWRMSQANENYEYCPTYPKMHILPATVDDSKLKQSLDFRALKRFPSVVWRDRESGVVMIRSSQPMSSFLGLSYYSNRDDVGLLEEIVNACNREREALQGPGVPRQHNGGPLVVNGQGDGEANGAQGSLEDDLQHGGASTASNDSTAGCKLAIVDCRSLAGVWGNSFKGGGTEDEAVYKCTIINLDLANIHSVRDSFFKLRNLCHSYPEGSFSKLLYNSMWLLYISALLRGANIVVELVKLKRRPVLVHCSDGWDRTSQICSLSQLMMDPYYRTIEGFQMLVEREWLHFGHKFAERGGHDPKCTDSNQMSPIFLQFLDCVYQLTLQYPAEFEFNETYLIKLVKHSQACLFGTFLHNCEREREQCTHQSASVWALLRPGDLRFTNPLYKPKLEVLIARFSEHEVVLWQSVYMEGHRNQSDFYLDTLLPLEDGARAEGMPRSRSMDELSRSNPDSGRRNSDPSLAPGQESAAAAPTTTTSPGGIHDTSSSSTEILHYPEDSPPSAGARTDGSEKSPGTPKKGNLSSSPKLDGNERTEENNSLTQSVETVVAEGEDLSKCVDDSSKKSLSESSSCSSNLSTQQSLTSSIISCEVTEHDKEADSDATPTVDIAVAAVDMAMATVDDATPTVDGANNGRKSFSDDVIQCPIFQGVSESPVVKAPSEGSVVKTPSEGSVVKTVSSPAPFHVQSSLLAERLAQVDIHSNGVRSPPDSHQDQSPFRPGASPVATNGVRHSSATNGSPKVGPSMEDIPPRYPEKSPSSLSSSSTSSTISPVKPPSEPGVSRRARAASGASRDLSISPSPGNWTDTGRLRHASSSSETTARRLQCVRSTVSTSTSDISDSCVAQAPMSSAERGGMKQHIDVDGLTLYIDQRQELLTQLVSAKDHKIQELEQRMLRLTDVVKKAKAYVAGQQAQPPAGLEEVMMSSDSDGTEPSSLGATSNPSLDSWEPLEETEAKVQPWVPDHTVTHCAGCDGVFWMGRWKHHCRNCGKVFCDECTSYRAPVLHAHLNKPERVCRQCHDTLLQLSPGASSDGRIPTLVADG